MDAIPAPTNTTDTSADMSADMDTSSDDTFNEQSFTKLTREITEKYAKEQEQADKATQSESETTDSEADTSTDEKVSNDKKYRITVNNKQMEVTGKELRDAAQQHYAAADRLSKVKAFAEEVTAEKQKVEAVKADITKTFQELIHGHPNRMREFLKNSGFHEQKFLDIAKMIVDEYNMPPEQKQQMAVEHARQVERLKHQEEVQKFQKEKEQLAHQGTVNYINQQIPLVLGQVGIEVNKSNFDRLAYEWENLNAKSGHHVQPIEAAKVLAHKMQNELIAYLHKTTPAELAKVYGPKKAAELIAQFQPNRTQPVARPDNINGPRKSTNNKGPLSERDWNK